MNRGYAAARSFTLPERAKLILLYGRCNREYEEFRITARRERNLRDWNLPHPDTIRRWIEKFEETGSLEREPYHREK